MKALSIVALLALSPVVAFAADLSKIDRTIRKEPAYKNKPKYCLLVFGPEAKTRVWLVLDGDGLYVDRNGNGDLTEKGESIDAPKRMESFKRFEIGEIEEDRVKHTNLNLDLSGEQAWVSVTTQGTRLQASIGDGRGFLFSEHRNTVPIIHFNGPLVFELKQVKIESKYESRWCPVPEVLKPGERITELYVQIGTPGLGAGTFAAIPHGSAPEKIHPIARMDLGGTVKEVAVLKQRC